MGNIELGGEGRKLIIVENLVRLVVVVEKVKIGGVIKKELIIALIN